MQACRNHASRTRSILALLVPLAATGLTGFRAPVAAQAQDADGPRKVFVSVDMEGIGGIGTNSMTSSNGKDYALGRDLMTAEVNRVVETLFAHGVEQVLVNDSHGDMRNLRHTELDPRVEYIQGNTKPLGMVQGLDASFDGVVFLGYHARAGTKDGFLAHTGSGSVKGLWLNGIEVGEGGLNAAFAGELGVPVLMAAGDATFADQFNALTGAPTVTTKVAIGANVARLVHPDVVRDRLEEGLVAGLSRFDTLEPFRVGDPVRVQARFATTTRADVLEAIPGVERVDGFTVAYDAEDMDQAYRLIRLFYKYISF
jgi:D-amino peptidase